MQRFSIFYLLTKDTATMPWEVNPMPVESVMA